MTFNILNVTVLTCLNWLPPLRDIQIIALVVQINFTKMNHIELTFNSITRTSTGKHLYYTENFVCSRNNCFACQYWLYSTQCYSVDISGLLNIVAFEVNKKLQSVRCTKLFSTLSIFVPLKLLSQFSIIPLIFLLEAKQPHG